MASGPGIALDPAYAGGLPPYLSNGKKVFSNKCRSQVSHTFWEEPGHNTVTLRQDIRAGITRLHGEVGDGGV